QRLLEHGLVALALRRGEPAVEVAVQRSERELAAIGILEPQFAVANDPGAVKNAAGPACVRSHWAKDIDERSGTVGLDTLDDQRGAELRRPGRIAPHADEWPV